MLLLFVKGALNCWKLCEYINKWDHIVAVLPSPLYVERILCYCHWIRAWMSIAQRLKYGWDTLRVIVQKEPLMQRTKIGQFLFNQCVRSHRLAFTLWKSSCSSKICLSSNIISRHGGFFKIAEFIYSFTCYFAFWKVLMASWYKYIIIFFF